MTLGELYANREFVLSYELFPPKTDKGMLNLREQVGQLLAHEPDFITCTYGAGGSTQDKTLQTLAMVAELTDRPLASHLTCVGMTADDIRGYLQRAKDRGIQYIVALRGDPPEGEENFKPVDGGFSYGTELVAFIKKEFPDFGLLVGGYPETHPEAEDPQADIQHLKEKVDAGSDVVVTQLFYDNDLFLRFRDRCADEGIKAPIVPGLLPITSYKQVQRIMSLSGSNLPEQLHNALENVAGDEEGEFAVGVDWAIRQCEALRREGTPGIHFYVLNKSRATSQVLDALGE